MRYPVTVLLIKPTTVFWRFSDAAPEPIDLPDPIKRVAVHCGPPAPLPMEARHYAH